MKKNIVNLMFLFIYWLFLRIRVDIIAFILYDNTYKTHEFIWFYIFNNSGRKKQWIKNMQEDF